MNEPTEEEIKRFWEWCEARCVKCGHLISATIKKDMCCCHSYELDIDLNNLFKWAVKDDVVGVVFQYYPGGCRCEIAYICEAGFDTVESWIENRTKDERASKKLTPLALFWAINKIIKEGQ